jgi:hypothetical protein
LKTLNVNPESLDTIGTVVPFRQLSELGFFAVKPETIVRAVSLASKLPQGARLHMTLFHRLNITVLPNIPLTSLTIGWLQIQSFQHLDRPQTLIFGQIFQSLTLANLQELVLGYRQRPLMPEWPHEQFLALCERSAFPEGLRVLRIANFRIRERELIQILSALCALEHLELMNGDYREYRVDPADFLITDNILRALAFPARGLIPLLCHFVCYGQLQCTDSVFVNFVKSRLEEPVPGVFRVEIQSDSDEGSSCAPGFHGRGRE